MTDHYSTPLSHNAVRSLHQQTFEIIIKELEGILHLHSVVSLTAHFPNSDWLEIRCTLHIRQFNHRLWQGADINLAVSCSVIVKIGLK